MMLDYEWGNPAAAAAAMVLFGDESGGGGDGHVAMDEHATAMFDHYSTGHGIGEVDAGNCFSDYFSPSQPLTAAALFSQTMTTSSTTCNARYGLALPPAPSRIGLNLGVRTYFSSSLPEKAPGIAPVRVSRRRVRTARCQAEGCGADLTHAKHYHRRHKVCEFHSKASIVIAAGLSQRFCQQCSRFHVLSEFDQEKRSCRKRLADHNRRRRKSQDLTPTTTTQSNNNNGSTITTADGVTNSTASPQKPEVLFFTTNSSSSSSTAPPLFARCMPETDTSLTNVPSSPAPALQYHSPTKNMALGLGCGRGAATLQTGLSASSSTETSPRSISFLSQLGNEQRFGGWDDGEDGSSIRELFQSK